VIQAIILVGGEGRRLRPLTDTRPKPMMMLVDRPFVAHQLDHLRRFGITDAIFSCGYRPEAIEAHFGAGERFGMTLGYVVDPQPLGTAGAIKNAEPLITGDRILVLNGDILTDLDIDALVAQHDREGVDATLALTPVDDPSRYGLVRLGPDRRVAAFVEKPTPEQLRPDEPFLINAGTYLVERRVFDAIRPNVPGSIERDIFPVLARDGRLAGFPSDCYWRDIGTPESYLQAHLDVLAGVVRTQSPTCEAFTGEECVIAGDAVVAAGSTVGEGTRVASGARITRSVVGSRSTIGDDVQIDGSIVGSGVTIGAGARLAGGVVVGDDARIPSGATLRDTSVPTGADLGTAHRTNGAGA
jgi:mannose-1-phosphate guanylyltransferase